MLKPLMHFSLEEKLDSCLLVLAFTPSVDGNLNCGIQMKTAE